MTKTMTQPMTYLHSKHAGNFGDVIKHTIHCAILQYLSQQTTPINYYETHAGAGKYEITTNACKANKGIKLLIEYSKKAKQPLPDCIQSYVDLIIQINHNKLAEEPLTYAGSPWFAQQWLTPHSQMSLFENQPTIHQKLDEFFNADHRVQCFCKDGYSGVLQKFNETALDSRSKENMSYVLIDPPYVEKDDYGKSIQIIQHLLKQETNTIIALWYPVINKAEVQTLEKQLSELAMTLFFESIELFEITLRKDDQSGLRGAGMVLINLPKALADELKQELKCLAALLAQDMSESRYKKIAK